jgi:hypothetical protein
MGGFPATVSYWKVTWLKIEASRLLSLQMEAYQWHLQFEPHQNGANSLGPIFYNRQGENVKYPGLTLYFSTTLSP